MSDVSEERFMGVLVGMAVGDALGLPREGLSRGRARRMFGERVEGHRLILGRGMVSDDTEHACMTGQALVGSGGEVGAFGRKLGWKLRWWLVGVPAGVGWGTLRAIVKLWCGFGLGRSGVRSAGNGPAMRGPVLGVWGAARGVDAAELRELVEVSTRVTHADERAVEGALAVAIAARCAAEKGVEGFVQGEVVGLILAQVRGEELRERLQGMIEFLKRGATAAEYVEALGMEKGVGGYINATVPAALYCCLRQAGDFREAVEEMILLGGDTDTTGAIVGGVMGAMVGEKGIPREWVEGIWEWPRSVRWMRELGRRMAKRARGEEVREVGMFWPGVVLRNVVFLCVVLWHGVRRVLPPY